MKEFLISAAISTLFIVPLFAVLIWAVERAAAMGHKQERKGQREDASYEHKTIRLQPARHP